MSSQITLAVPRLGAYEGVGRTRKKKKMKQTPKPIPKPPPRPYDNSVEILNLFAKIKKDQLLGAPSVWASTIIRREPTREERTEILSG